MKDAAPIREAGASGRPRPDLGRRCAHHAADQYIELVDDTGRQVRKDQRGAIPAAEPRALQKLGIGPEDWTHKVKGVGSGFWRVVGTVDDIQEKAVAMGQAFLRGIGFARALVTG